MNRGHPGQDHIVSNCDMAGKGTVIREDTVIPDYTIVRNMAIGHDQTIVTDNGLTAVYCASVDGHVFSYGGVIADFGSRLFVLELEILRYGRYYRTRKNVAVLSDTGTFHDGHVGSDPGSFSNHHIVMNGRERLDHHILGDFGSRMNIC